MPCNMENTTSTPSARSGLKWLNIKKRLEAMKLQKLVKRKLRAQLKKALLIEVKKACYT